ncbi:UPF0182 family protein [Actinomadura sp. KC216]|uniref:UPF0182 family membrane protein n=1 Tax=Actinomadura sp. KC216 TaxID=2530370 RepID=UPI001048075A|nr:UPF0182 family protein [Actinomadura sp. KC216]TDB79632.1 UPF0182 family protein [Actinomadura sp. KC216]
MTFRTPGFGRRLGSGRTRLVLPALVTLAVLLIAFMVFTATYTNLLWYDSIGFQKVYTTQIKAKVALFFGAGLLMVLVVGANVAIAYRLRPAYRPLSVEQQGLERYRTVIDPRRRLIAWSLLGLLGVLTGSSAAGQWPVWLAFLNRTSFGVKDPQFHKDVSFYVFTYPFLRLIIGVIFATVILSILAAVMVHYLYGGLRLQGPGDKASPPARAHLSVLFGLFILLKAVAYWFDRYGLVHSERGVRTGASYADVNALLPAKTILMIIALLCAAMFFSNLLRRGMMLPGVGFTLLVLSAILLGGVYPLLIQQFQVKPDELAKERAYIQRNIEFTRQAYGVDGAKVVQYGSQPVTDKKKLQQEADTLGGVRVLDPAVVGETFRQFQQIRPFYQFPDTLDVDRYQVDGRQIDTIVALRELSGAPREQRSWVKDHMVYTHGYGFVSAYGDRFAEGGVPEFITKNMPVSPDQKIKVDKPEIYFGERSAKYSVVGGQGQQELNYPDNSDKGQRSTTYDGDGGVPIDSFLNKLLYSAKFQDKNLLLSGAINKNAKILYDRSPRQMVQKAAPWLTLDGDPYPAVVNGRILWIVDGYTTSNSYPYSEEMSLGDATRDTITDTRSAVARQADDHINYMRNSVKATVDAYDGSVHLYQWDENDPITKTWMKVFDGTVQPRSSIPPELEAHFRYPQDLFKVQRKILTQYHVTDPGAFYNGEGFWEVPEDPAAKEKRQPPYYQSLRMPGQNTASFSLTTVFTPGGNTGGNPQLAAFMAVGSTPGRDYGQIQILQMPRNAQPAGPGQVQNSFETDEKVKAALFALRQGGTKTVPGNLLTIPFGGGLLYVEPMYTKAAGGKENQPYPILGKILVRYGNSIVAADTLDDALRQILGGTGTDTGTTPPAGTPPQGGQLSPELLKARADLRKALQDFEAAQKKGDYAAMGEAWKQLKEAEAALWSASQAPAAQPSPSPSPSGSPSVSPSPSGSPSPS